VLHNFNKKLQNSQITIVSKQLFTHIAF